MAVSTGHLGMFTQERKTNAGMVDALQGKASRVEISPLMIGMAGSTLVEIG